MRAGFPPGLALEGRPTEVYPPCGIPLWRAVSSVHIFTRCVWRGASPSRAKSVWRWAPSREFDLELDLGGTISEDRIAGFLGLARVRSVFVSSPELERVFAHLRGVSDRAKERAGRCRRLAEREFSLTAALDRYDAAYEAARNPA